MRSTEGTSVIVTGGGSGLGAATAAHMARLGARVTVCGRRPEKVRSVAESIGPNCAWVRADVDDPDDRGRVLAGLRDVLDSESEMWEEEYRFRRADGSYACVSDRGFVVRDRKGRPVRMVGSMRDITERRRHEEDLRSSEELFRTTFEAAAVGMAHLSSDGRWLRINAALCEISGYPREELLGMSYRDLTPPEDLGAGEERARRLLAGDSGPYAVERRFVREDGSRVWVNLSMSVVRTSSGKPDYLVCVAEDITGRKIGELLTEPLTAREMEVLRGMVSGQKNQQIAEDLTHSVGTVKLEVRQLLCKLGAKDRREAVSRAVEIGLVAPPPC